MLQKEQILLFFGGETWYDTEVHYSWEETHGSHGKPNEEGVGKYAGKLGGESTGAFAGKPDGNVL